MILFKIIVLAFLVALFFIFRKWFIKHNYILLLFIPVIILIIYSDYFIKIDRTNNLDSKAELEKWKQDHKDNFVNPGKYNSKDAGINKRKIGDVLYDTTFNVNTIKIHYKEFLVVPPANEFSYDSTRVEMQVIDENDSVLQTIKEDIDAICSPIDSENPYHYFGKEGIFYDYNFDGYKDFALRISNGPNNHSVNGYFYIYLFDAATKNFIKYDEELTNPLPNKDRNEIECEIAYSTTIPSTETEYYKWVNGKLEITESIAYEQLYEQPKKDVLRIKETRTIYRNGRTVSKTEKIIEEKN
jgi:hypothetical protein